MFTCFSWWTTSSKSIRRSTQTIVFCIVSKSNDYFLDSRCQIFYCWLSASRTIQLQTFLHGISSWSKSSKWNIYESLYYVEETLLVYSYSKIPKNFLELSMLFLLHNETPLKQVWTKRTINLAIGLLLVGIFVEMRMHVDSMSAEKHQLILLHTGCPKSPRESKISIAF